MRFELTLEQLFGLTGESKGYGGLRSYTCLVALRLIGLPYPALTLSLDLRQDTSAFRRDNYQSRLKALLREPLDDQSEHRTNTEPGGESRT